jgi:formylglycine-generating enzyme required for sulfatase activity
MKYEAKFGGKGAISQATELPARGAIAQSDARSSCRNLGPGYALINNDEWMTIASNMANVATNWSGGSVGSGALNRGHSDGTPADALAAVTDDNDPCNGTGQTCSSSTWDSQRRTHVLSNSNVIWDFSGNVWEWVDYFNYNNKPTPTNAAWNEYTAVSGSTYMAKNRLVPTNALKSWWSDSWNGATNGIGQYVGGANGGGGALLRGGSWGDGSSAGVFAVYLYDGPSVTRTNVGFRCVFRPSSL